MRNASRVLPGSEHPQHDFLCGAVQGAGGLVGEDERPAADDGTSDRDALLLPAGQIRRVPVRPVGELHHAERVQGRPVRLLAAPAVQFEREADILHRGERGDEVEVLEHEAQAAPAQCRQLPGLELAEPIPFDNHLAAGRRGQAAGDGEQGRLAGAGGAHDRDELAAGDCEVDTGEGGDGGFAAPVLHGHAIKSQEHISGHELTAGALAGRPRLGTSVLSGSGAANPAATARASRASE